MQTHQTKTNKSLRFSFLDGIFASAMMGFTQDYFTPFLLLLGGSARHVGILSAFPNLFASLLQLKSADLVEKLKSRRRIVNLFVFLQALMLVPMVAVAFSGGTRPAIFIVLVVLFASLGAVAMPAWGSMMSDLIKKDKRGEYFGWRNKVLGFIIVGTTFGAGLLLNGMKKVNIFYGFAILFGSAFVFRMLSWYFLTRMHEPYLEHSQEHHFTIFDFLRRIRQSNFAQFVLFVSLMNFSVNLASPFFAVLMLKDLKFDYLLYTIITVSATLTIYVVSGRWGCHADQVGNLKIIRFTAPFIGAVPLLWIINRNPVFLIAAQVFSGFVWAGFNLCASNFIYDAVTPEKRTRCISYFNVFSGLGLCAGSLLGGFLIQRLPPLFGNRILTLLFISSLLRCGVGLLLPMQLKEVREVGHIGNGRLFLSMLGIRPIIEKKRKGDGFVNMEIEQYNL